MFSHTDRSLPRTLVLCMILCSGACGASGRYTWVHERPPEPREGGRVLIGAGDLIEVQVFGDEQSSTTGRVLADGTLTVPLLGPVYVIGQRPEELAAALEMQLKRLIQVPKVTVLIRESVVSVSVIGEVRKGGVIDMVAPAMVLEALAKAEGLTEFADGSCIFVLRTTGTKTERIRFDYDALVKGDAAAGTFQLKTGDVLVVE